MGPVHQMRSLTGEVTTRLLDEISSGRRRLRHALQIGLAEGQAMQLRRRLQIG